MNPGLTLGSPPYLLAERIQPELKP
jgi:hypothetical protein